jgi:hypothetical protein
MGAMLSFVIGFFLGALVGVVALSFLVMARRSSRREPKPSGRRGYGPMDAPSQS